MLEFVKAEATKEIYVDGGFSRLTGRAEVQFTADKATNPDCDTLKAIIVKTLSDVDPTPSFITYARFLYQELSNKYHARRITVEVYDSHGDSFKVTNLQ